MLQYWVYVEGKKFLLCSEKEQAENVARYYNGEIREIEIPRPIVKLRRRKVK